METSAPKLSNITHEKILEPSYGLFSSRDRAYMQDAGRFKDYLRCEPNIEHFEALLNEKKEEFTPARRQLLCDVLEAQYAERGLTDDTMTESLDKLKSENTFTIVTAHQPCLMTGPLYFIYKIASAVSLARKVEAKFPQYNIIPMYVIGSEDHDFEEINHLRLFNKKLTWETEQSGAVGHMKLENIEQVLTRVQEMLGDEEYATDILEKVRRAYDADHNLALATSIMVGLLFQGTGLLVADLDNKELKGSCTHLFESELTRRTSKNIVQKSHDELEQMGFDSQVFAREINLFYVDKGSRTRITYSDGKWSLNNNKAVDENELKSLLESYPERFSPNVILRPLYQQLVLPGIAYVGGGSEVAYWMEIKRLFDTKEISFPMLVRRDSALWIKPYTLELMQKVGITTSQLFSKMHEVQEDYLAHHLGEEWTLHSIDEKFDTVFQQLFKEIEQIDHGLVKMAKGFQVQQQNFVNKLESKLKKSLKSQNDTAMGRIEKVWKDLFPDNGLQERYANFIGIYARTGPKFISELIEHFNPLEPGLHIFKET